MKLPPTHEMEIEDSVVNEIIAHGCTIEDMLSEISLFIRSTIINDEYPNEYDIYATGKFDGKREAYTHVIRLVQAIQKELK